ncbi:oocyte zinc finger protein XlCOF6.1-like [Melanotaenia boesemani]|uniref:oocyte zinc finger protein XlCOF6.1-like n=1 Tax=Melanotaenia boesemani TaxID=1250792 RepID=UPI001C04F2F6|nr:oocyte zinc finger protein XlCOF6.1-like [Melanotaenia boesemani]XP_041830736.1 oocyte zinc finger protein XlCOF6.1-like [Melanotaenia boesemani]
MAQRKILQPVDPRGLGLVPPISAASTSELEEIQDSKDLTLPADVQQLLVIKEEVPWSSSLDQQDPEPVHVKEEKQELWTSQKLDEQEETDINRFSLNAVNVKSDDDEEQPQSSQLHRIKAEDGRETEPPAGSSDIQMKTETDGEDCGGPEPTRNLDPNSYLEPNSDQGESDSSQTEVSDDDCWQNSSVCGPEAESGSLINHMQVHSAEKLFGCDDCGKRFSNNTHLKAHMRTHTGEKPFDCELCGKRFNKKTNLKTHVQIHTGKKPFSCSDCGKRFYRNSGLNRHMHIHKGEKTFGCDHCGKRFNLNANLKAHTRIHVGEKPFSCDDCGKRFYRNTCLKRHMIVHTREQLFSCNDCGKKFRRNSCLKRHMMIHTGEKAFGCDECGKRFSRNAVLITHMRVHTGEKPYGCDDCGKRFSHKVRLKSHVSVHTRETCWL